MEFCVKSICVPNRYNWDKIDYRNEALEQWNKLSPIKYKIVSMLENWEYRESGSLKYFSLTIYYTKENKD